MHAVLLTCPCAGVQVHFDGYNRRYGSDGTHETLEWSEYDGEVLAFKRKHILQDIINTEINDLSYPPATTFLPLHVVGFTFHPEILVACLQ